MSKQTSGKWEYRNEIALEITRQASNTYWGAETIIVSVNDYFIPGQGWMGFTIPYTWKTTSGQYYGLEQAIRAGATHINIQVEKFGEVWENCPDFNIDYIYNEISKAKGE